jgi:hypothetical protein
VELFVQAYLYDLEWFMTFGGLTCEFAGVFGGVFAKFLLGLVEESRQQVKSNVLVASPFGLRAYVHHPAKTTPGPSTPLRSAQDDTSLGALNIVPTPQRRDVGHPAEEFGRKGSKGCGLDLLLRGPSLRSG